ncbi:MAG: 5-oxoprolinase subunit PxpB [Clostridia bacterium]
MQVTCLPAGDKAILVQFDQEISVRVNNQVSALAKTLVQLGLSGVEELVPAYASLLIYYNPLRISYARLVHTVQTLCTQETTVEQTEPRTVVIPACYGGECGPDLADVADYHGITQEEVVRIHSSAVYRVYMLGFSPGFPYLGGLSTQIATPRLSSPRLKVSSGSIGIAGAQTGIYPLSSPGGWRLIARTPLRLFDLSNSHKPFLLQAGDQLQFVPVSLEKFKELEAAYHSCNGTA